MVVYKIPDVKKLLLDEHSFINLDIGLEDLDAASTLKSANCNKGAITDLYSVDARYRIVFRIKLDEDEIASFSENGQRITELTRLSKFQQDIRTLKNPTADTPTFATELSATLYFNRNHWEISRKKIKIEAIITDITNLPIGDIGVIQDKQQTVTWEFAYDANIAIHCPVTIVNFPLDIATNIVARYENNRLLQVQGSPKEKAYTYRLEPDIDMNGKFDDYKNTAIIEIFPIKTPLFTLNDVRPQFLMQWNLQSLNEVTEFLFPIGNPHTFIIGNDGIFIDTHGGIIASDLKYYRALEQVDINAGRMGFTLEQDYICKGIVVPNRKIITKRLENIIWDGRSFPQSVNVTVTKQ
jgi:hypothetical protein